MKIPSCLLALFLTALAASPAPPGPEWKPFTSKPGKFTAVFPGTPTEQKQSVKTAVGTIEMTLYVLDLPKASGSYVIDYSELPEAAVRVGTEEKRLDNARDGAVASAKGKLKSEKRISLQGFHGRDLVIEVGDKRSVRMRIFAVNNRLYQLLAAGPPAWVASKDTGRFFDSFKLSR
jgi:hypothetical protein